MSEESSQPLDDIVANSAQDSVVNIRPGNSGWTPDVPVDAETEKPQVNINVPALEDGTSPNIGEITVTDVNESTGSVTVTITSPGGEVTEVLANEPLPENGVLVVEPPVPATVITITLENPSDEQQESYAITVDVKACEEYPSKHYFT